MNSEKRYMVEWFPPEDENDFLVNVRIYSQWNEEHFDRMVSAANDLLHDFAKMDVISEKWDGAFADSIRMLINLLRHPGFLAENEFGMTQEEYKTFIDQRINILADLEKRYWEVKQHK